MELYGESLDYERYLEVEKRAQEVLPDLDKLIAKLRFEATLFQEATFVDLVINRGIKVKERRDTTN